MAGIVECSRRAYNFAEEHAANPLTFRGIRRSGDLRELSAARLRAWAATRQRWPESQVEIQGCVLKHVQARASKISGFDCSCPPRTHGKREGLFEEQDVQMALTVLEHFCYAHSAYTPKRPSSFVSVLPGFHAQAVRGTIADQQPPHASVHLEHLLSWESLACAA